MLTLRTKAINALNFPADDATRIMRVSKDVNLPMPLRRGQMYLAEGPEMPSGYAAYGMFDTALNQQVPAGCPSIVLPLELGYVAHNDVIAFEPGNRALRVLYRRESPSNFFFVTERCNNYCLMCSQPPRDVDDS